MNEQQFGFVPITATEPWLLSVVAEWTAVESSDLQSRVVACWRSCWLPTYVAVITHEEAFIKDSAVVEEDRDNHRALAAWELVTRLLYRRTYNKRAFGAAVVENLQESLWRGYCEELAA